VSLAAAEPSGAAAPPAPRRPDAPRRPRLATRLLLPAVPLARVAWLRAALSVFACVDALLLTDHVLQHAHAAGYWAPGALARALHVPAPTPLPAGSALAVLVLGTLVVLALPLAARRAPGPAAAARRARASRVAATAVAAAYLLWLLWSTGFGYVGHDHLAVFVADVVLATAPAAGYADLRPSRAAGWAVRTVQLATVATYFGSAVSKWVRSGTPWGWAKGAVFVWAVLRRGSPLVQWTLQVPGLLVVGQWALLSMELLSPLVLLLRGRRLALAVAGFLAFHLVTFLALGIHFLPTVVCWLAFAPLERLPAAVAAARARRAADAGLTASRPA